MQTGKASQAALFAFGSLVAMAYCLGGSSHFLGILREAWIYLAAICLAAFIFRLLICRGGLAISAVIGSGLALVGYFIAIAYAVRHI